MADPFALVTLYFQTALQRYTDDILMLANLQSAVPSRFGLATLPGPTDLDKVSYLLDYLDEGSRSGLSAYDMIARCHDSGLRKAQPVRYPGAPPIRDPRQAARYSFRGAEGTLDLIEANLSRDGIFTDEQFAASPQYGAFWKMYGLT